MPSLNTKLATAPNTTSNFVLRATSSTTIGNSTIQDDGTNVAIGTTPGTYKLNVSGTGNFTGALSGTSATFSGSMGIGTTSLDTPFNVKSSNTSATTMTALALFYKNSAKGGALVISSNDSYADIKSTWYTAAANMGLTFTVINTSAVETTALTIASTGAATFSSSVTAGGDIKINNSGTTISNIAATSSQGGLNLYSGATADYNGGGLITLVSSDRGGAYTRGEIYISAGRATNNTANGFISLSTSDTERMRITSGGNVGIGTSGYSFVRLTARGENTSSGSWALFAEDSAATTIFGARNDGQVYAGAIASSTGTALVLTSGGYINKLSSSIRYKKNVQPIDIGLDFILSLNAVSYNLKDGDIPQVGFIAEDFPEDRLVSMSMIDPQDESKGYQKESVNYAQIVAPLVKAMQELNQTVQNQQQQINSLINR